MRRHADLLIAAAFLAEALFEVFVFVPSGAPDRGIAVLLVVLTAAALAVRRRWWSGLAGGPLFLAFNQLPQVYIDHLVSPTFACLFLVYGVARHYEWPIVAPVAAFTVVVMWISHALDEYDEGVGNYVLTLAAVLFVPVLLGRVLRNRSRLHRTLREKAERLERERVERAAAAAEDERARIAGELHDVVAHALSAMVVQAAGARRLAERDPARAGAAFGAIETSGREALTEIRSLLGVLRREDDELALAPQPSLRHVRSLVKRTAAAGLPVELEVEGDARELPFGVDLTAYRVVQEALGGALEHGHAGRARVRLRYADDHVDLEVDDDGETPTRPLLGIRERVTLAGGELRAGARREGGHVVSARLPLGGVA
jgi:signal transduction histidine kinase